MGKLNHGPSSRAKGKAGGWVYQQYEGMQVFREYQPNVKNPQTTKQTNNRAKFKSASQIVAQYSEALNIRLAKLSIYTRVRRGAAINAIYGVVETDPNGVSTAFENILRSINSKSMATIESPTVGSGAGNVPTITAQTGDVVTYIAANYDINGKLISREVSTYTSDGTAKAINPAVNAKTFGFMAVATRATTEDGRATLSNIAGINNAFLLAISRAIAAGDIAISDMVGGMMTLS